MEEDNKWTGGGGKKNRWKSTISLFLPPRFLPLLLINTESISIDLIVGWLGQGGRGGGGGG